MKTNNFFRNATFMCILFMATSCSNDDDATLKNNTALINVESTISDVNGTSRADLNGNAPQWLTGDKIGAKIDAETTVYTFSLTSGAGTTKGAFSGEVADSETSKNLYFYYPSEITETGAVDLTQQDGSNAKEMVMFATCPYSKTPKISFQNKTTILKLNMTIPDGTEFTGEELYVKVTGAYSKGTLGTDGNWTNPTSDVINVTNAQIIDGKISAYIVIIPGCNVNNIRIHVGGNTADGYKNFVTDFYTSGTTIESNKLITINKKLVVPASNYKEEYTLADYYKWGAAEYFKGENGSENIEDYTTIDLTKNDYSEAWINKCIITEQQLKILLGNGIYYDENGKDYKIIDTNTETNSTKGVWLKKLVYCDISKTKSNTISLENDQKNNNQYFFLPLTGYYDTKFHNVGTQGSYWTNTPHSNDNNGKRCATRIYIIYSTKTNISYIARSYGFIPMVCE